MIEQYGPFCPDCHLELEWQECQAIGCEDGFYDAYEFDDPLWFEPYTMVRCEECHGHGGDWYCIQCQCYVPFGKVMVDDET